MKWTGKTDHPQLSSKEHACCGKSEGGEKSEGLKSLQNYEVTRNTRGRKINWSGKSGRKPKDRTWTGLRRGRSGRKKVSKSISGGKKRDLINAFLNHTLISGSLIGRNKLRLQSSGRRGAKESERAIVISRLCFEKRSRDKDETCSIRHFRGKWLGKARVIEWPL